MSTNPPSDDYSRSASPEPEEATASPDKSDPWPDARATWNPSQGDPFDDLWDDGPPSDTSGKAPTRLVDEKPSGFVPESVSEGAARPISPSRLVADIWGEDFAGATPRTTLKNAVRGTPRTTPPPITAADMPIDVRLEGYDMLEVLGEGGVGIVYQARQKSIDRQIAVKMIKPGVGRDPHEKEKFIAEAMVTGKLDHPNIVPVHDLGSTADGQPFYAMKMVRGTQWNEAIRTRSLDENLSVLLDVCDAVSFAHARGVIHRDLKPENVMLGEFGEVQVMDWGLGVIVDQDGRCSNVRASIAAGGTPAYMSPEMVTGGPADIGIHSDIYLLGAILFEVISGKPPHAGKRVLDCLQNASANVIQPTEASGVLLDIALRAMRTDPAERYPSVKAFKEALLAYQTHAQSIRLCEQSRADVERAQETGGYDLFSQALFGFRKALEFWPENTDARVGLQRAQLAYARCAASKGDLDLAASTLDTDCKAHSRLAHEIRAAQHRRDTARRRMRVLQFTAIGLTVVVLVTLTCAFLWVSAAKQREESAKLQALDAKEAALDAQAAEAEQRRLAEVARTKAEQEEARAVQALEDLERATRAMVEAQSQEERAVAQARAAELVATQTRDELAKTGMLLDNSWWVFGAEEAAARQQRAADALGMPVALSVMLPDETRLEMVLIPPGEFVMGSPPNEPQRSADEYLHRAAHTRPYYIGRYELTRAQWAALLGAPPDGAAEAAEPGPGGRPLAGVSYEQIVDGLLPALNEHAPAGWVFRLPSEAEWEFACRAGQGSAYHAGETEEDLAEVGWYLANSARRVHAVGEKRPNAFGLYDMHGNVGEICADEYNAGFYLESPVNDPVGPPGAERPIVRGGSVLNTPAHCRAAYRSYIYRENTYEFVGLRVVLTEAD